MFTPAGLRPFLAAYTQNCPALLIAYSGGLDSHVLLHALAQLRAAADNHPQTPTSIRAIHINHGLQPAAAAWARHCQQVCADLNINLETVTLKLSAPKGSSLEAVAREARYQAFMTALKPNEILLTAHHQDDQAETLLLNLLRGAGPDGLAAMPAVRPLAQSWLGRPLLTFSRADLVAYAQQQSLRWIEDPSNQSTVFDRNYLRQQIIPALQQRWPAASELLARAAQWQQETVSLTAELLAERLKQLQGTQTGTLSVSGLLACTRNVRKAVIRQWLKQLDFSMPSAKKLQHLLQDVLRAKADALPCVAWDGCEIRRYRDDVYALPPLTAHDPQQILSWADLQQPLMIASLSVSVVPAVLGELRALIQRCPDHKDSLTVRFRQGGERLLKPDGRHISLKQWLQEKGVVPWQRDRLPLVYYHEQLIVIPGLYRLRPDQLQLS